MITLNRINVNNLDTYANKYQIEIVSNAILSFRDTDHWILVWTRASAENLANLSTQSNMTTECIIQLH